MVLGRRGTGKSHYIINDVIPLYLQAHPQMKILIIDTMDHPMYRMIAPITIDMIPRWRRPAVYRCFDPDTPRILHTVANSLYNCVVIHEDASKYIRRTVSDDVRRYILDSKQKNLDLIFLFHGFSFAPPEIWRIIDGVTIFKCDNPTYRRADIVNFEEINQAWKKVIADPNPYAKETIWIY